MWFDADKLKEALESLNESMLACDCGRTDGWHLWSCVTVPQSLRDCDKAIKAEEHRRRR